MPSFFIDGGSSLKAYAIPRLICRANKTFPERLIKDQWRESTIPECHHCS